MENEISKNIIDVVYAVIIGVIIAAVTALIIWLIIGDNYGSLKYKEVRVNNGSEFDKRVSKQNGIFTNYLENCTIEFKEVDSDKIVSIDLTKILYTRGCSKGTCVATIDGEKYAINPNNTKRLVDGGTFQYIEGCALTKKEKGMY
ncbi:MULTISPECIES: hypothetical protein [Aliarcobacter]|uniref:hypothetical protein n=1 Tax=Aliarcobacter TaxID=2321111 RepID=UPI0021B1BCB4|nr:MULTISPECIES: hypothetical protein [Aliarcobacter]MCT7464800.1 hypothetical protein [Aliarcobacter cryaerophilus]MCT7597267.1 hypothetical protein [Aliarcobacter butzleri]